jgi:outer membrane protein assembly factor BamE (lipoprotein component of BamABCDE complex)
MRYQHLRPLFVGLSLLSLAACGFPIDDRGNLPKPDALAQIKPGVTDMASVRRLLGTPSSIASFDDNTWYYISKTERRIAFLKPEILGQNVYAIHFDQNGVVTAIDHKGIEDAQSVTPNADITPAPGREFTFLEQLIGNFGKFNNAKNNNSPGGPNTGGP